MFEKLIRQAEQVSSDLGHSRRRFLGRAGRGALAAAGALGVLLAAPTRAPSESMGVPCAACHNECRKACGNDKSCYDSCLDECRLICF
jgi:hypothetical protein